MGQSEAMAQQDVNCRVASSESYTVVLIMHVAVQFNLHEPLCGGCNEK